MTGRMVAIDPHAGTEEAVSCSIAANSLHNDVTHHAYLDMPGSPLVVQMHTGYDTIKHSGKVVYHLRSCFSGAMILPKS